MAVDLIIPKLLGLLPEFCIQHYANTPVFTQISNKIKKDIYPEEYLKRVCHIANALKKAKIKSGDIVMTLMKSNYEWNFLDTAISRLGAIHLPFYKINMELMHAVSNLNIKLCITNSEETKLKQIVQEKFSTLSFEELKNSISTKNNALDTCPQANISENDAAYIMYSFDSNSTIRPFLIPHRNFLTLAKQTSLLLPLNLGERYLSLLPVSKVFERSVQLAHLLLACNIYYVQTSAFPSTIIKNSEAQSCSIVPSLLEYPLRVPPELKIKYGKNNIRFHTAEDEDLKMFYGNKFRHFICGGAALKTDIANLYFKSNIPIFNGYGLTQSSGAFTMNTYKNNKIGSVGICIGNNKIKFNSEKEILIKGETVVDYFFDKNELKLIKNDDWLKTGDIGYMDKSGFLYIEGNKRAVFKMSNGLFLDANNHEKKLSELFNCQVMLCRSINGELHLILDKKLSIKEHAMLHNYRIIDFAAYSFYSYSETKHIPAARPYFYEYNGTEKILHQI